MIEDEHVMRKIAIAVAASFMLLTAAPAQAKWSACAHAKPVRHAVIQKFGRRAPGRDICRFGKLRWNGKVRRSTFDERIRYLHVLRRMNMPPRLVPLMHAGPPPNPPAGTATPRANLPYCTWGPESGGSYTARNPSGAGGKYQIMPGTWHAYGGSGGNAANASPAEQDMIAAKIYAAEGGRPWVNC